MNKRSETQISLIPIMAGAVWFAFMLLPLVSVSIAAYHGVIAHTWLSNMTFTLIGLTYVGATDAANWSGQKGTAVFALTSLCLLAYWY